MSNRKCCVVDFPVDCNLQYQHHNLVWIMDEDAENSSSASRERFDVTEILKW
jgi:hypothetical protein